MKKRVIALIMAVALIGTNAGFSQLGNTVVHAADAIISTSCGSRETDHKNITATYTWKTDKTCVAAIECDDCDFETEKNCTIKENVLKAATCTADGESEFVAVVTFGGKSYTNPQTLVDTVKATGHTKEVTKAAKPATCTEDGYTEEAKCKGCGIMLAESKIEKATGHKEVVTPGKVETCTEDGYTDKTTCSLCSTVLVASEVIPAGHKYLAHEFAWSGYSECFVTIGCRNCDFSVEAECKTIVLTKVDPTCTEDGYDLYTATCVYDGQEFHSTKMGDESTVKPKLGHSYKNYVCERCNEPKPYAEVVLLKDKTTKTYTGETLTVADDIYEVKKGSGAVTLEYYLDEACTMPTYAGDEGKETSAPVDAGTYFVKVVIAEDEEYRANDSEGVHKFVIRPGRVSSLKAVNNKSTIKLSWKKNEQATGYIIYRKTDSTEYEPLVYIEDIATLSFSDDTIKQGTKYRYNIVAYKISENGEEVLSLKREVGTNIVRTKVTSITNQNGSVRVKWTKVENAEGYKVWRKASGEDKYQLIEDVKGEDNNAYTDKGSKAIRNGKASYYYVVPYYKESSNVVLKTSARTNYYMTRPSISSLTTSGSKALKVEWAKNASANGYQIRYSLNSDMSDAEVITVASKSTLSKKISGLKANKTYYVQVRSYKTYKDVNYYSSWSAKKSKQTK